MKKSLLTTLILFSIIRFSFAQSKDLTAFISNTNKVFENGNEQELADLFPFEEQKTIFKTIVSRKSPRKAGAYKVIQEKGNTATVLLTGILTTGDSGLETFYSSFYTGIYELSKENGTWKVKNKIPAGTENQILSHTITADVVPGKGITATDTMAIVIQNPLGFWFSLNHTATIKAVKVNGKKRDYFFHNGLVLLNHPKIKKANLVIEYELPVGNEAGGYGYFTEDLGNVTKVYNWHPLFSFSSPNDKAFFSVSARIPASYHLSTSFPQTVKELNNYKFYSGKSAYQTNYAGLYYDKNWSPVQTNHKNINIELFTSPYYKPKKDSLLLLITESLDLLSDKFGNPISNYLGVIQDASSKGNGWKLRANDVIVSNNRGTFVFFDKPAPRAIIQHEIAHGWTDPTGPAKNFLMEGWASFAETYFIHKRFGDDALQRYYDRYKQNYFKSKLDSNVSIWNDSDNSGVSYYKGVWVLKILNDILGSAAFEKGLKAYMQIPGKEVRDIYAFSKKLSEAGGYDVWPVLEPWLKSKTIPIVSAQVKDNKVVITQLGETFAFPLEIKFNQEGKQLMHKYKVKKKEQEFELVGLDTSKPIALEVDPNHQMLLHTR